ncbi:MAG TPA: carboxypeptidase regulatory-like domain-containing protein [Gemmatimonadales bacterium]|nr:carboxypeptidase regulatory-like domain-containing protein [Gemmatimonadales bacterium]
MSRLAVAVLAVTAFLGAPVAAAQGVVVTVLNEHGQPVEGVAGQVGDLLATSGSDGLIYFLGLAPGRYHLTMRIPGYHPDLRNVVVTDGAPVRLTVRLNSASRAQRPVISGGASPGLRGLVTDAQMQPIAGAEVHLLGRRGRVMPTDSAGGFHAVEAEGTYMVRVVAAGARESRFSVTMPGGDTGLEALVPLLPADTSYTGTSNAEQLLLRQLGRRLSATRPQSRLTRDELAAYGFRSLCEVPEIAARMRRASGSELSGLEDGQRLINVCAVRANEAELVELNGRVIVWTPR